MIAFVRGAIASRDGGGVVIDVGGVGLRVAAPTSTLGRLGGVGEQATLHTYLLVREDALSLFGFASEDERRTFELLLSVSGLGPKGALGILSALSVDQLRQAVALGNADLLTVVPGIGKRIASRVVLDLKDRLGAGRFARGGGAAPSSMPTSSGATTLDGEVVEALIQLGYSAPQAAQAVAALPADAPVDLEERLRAALRHFSSAR